MKINRHSITRSLSLLALPFLFYSCGSVFDDLDPCPEGMRLRFVYNHNLEEANSFPSQVDCLTVHIYDSAERLVKTVTESSDVLADENYRMDIDLPAGDYTAVAYGGIACDESSFSHTSDMGFGAQLSSITMGLNEGHAGRRLHDLFQGRLSFTVEADTPTYGEATLPMMKLTNHYRILLHKTDGTPTDGNDFDFFIEDSNSLLDHLNMPATHDLTRYDSYVKGAVQIKDVEPDQKPDEVRADEENTSTMAFAELSTPRLWLGNRPILTIYSHEAKRNVLRMPLNELLLLEKGEFDKWTNQEYLDRCSNWRLTLFLNSDYTWSQTVVIVNGWTVRINNLEM